MLLRGKPTSPVWRCFPAARQDAITRRENRLRATNCRQETSREWDTASGPRGGGGGGVRLHTCTCACPCTGHVLAHVACAGFRSHDNAPPKHALRGVWCITLSFSFRAPWPPLKTQSVNVPSSPSLKGAITATAGAFGHKLIVPCFPPLSNLARPCDRRACGGSLLN
eukprot:scaffold56604_cov33-Phaeocystis_antarctica.AAC.1